MIDSIVFAAWSFAAFASVILALVEWRRRDGFRRHVGLWLSLRIHRFRTWLEELEGRIDDELVRS